MELCGFSMSLLFFCNFTRELCHMAFVAWHIFSPHITITREFEQQMARKNVVGRYG